MCIPSGDRTVAVLQLPLSHTLREPEEELWGLRIILPVTFGFYDYDFGDIFNQGLPEGLSTMSFVPGLELEKQITSRWRFKPYVSAGAGWELGGAEYAWIYDVGLRSRFRIGEDKGVDFALVNRVESGGIRCPQRVEPASPLFRNRHGHRRADTGRVTGAPHHIWHHPGLLPLLPPFALCKVQRRRQFDRFELAISVLTRRPFSIFGIDVDRIGIAVRGGDGVTGFRLFTSLPF